MTPAQPSQKRSWARIRSESVGKSNSYQRRGGADERIRTADLRITNALLYQLSYVGSALSG